MLNAADVTELPNSDALVLMHSSFTCKSECIHVESSCRSKNLPVCARGLV